ncbi:MAG: type III pantothenate kinase [Betaproteobacteria bacterium]|nr:MAG: type III pantothenate kinase [Betaproteobacteria bacterium]
MILVIDAGNTRIKWGAREAGTWHEVGACATADSATLASVIGAGRRYGRVLVANVAGPNVRADIERGVAGTGCAAEFIVSRGAQCGVRSSYDEPGQLGCDRWSALVGAHHLFPGACLVVGAGTALTVDALTEDGLFLGGIIVPGMELMRRALDEHTAGLALRPGEVRFFPANTGDAIVSGAAQACAGAVERMATFMRESGHESLRVIMSGGGAGQLRNLLALDTVVVENLVLEGLAAMVEEGC